MARPRGTASPSSTCSSGSSSTASGSRSYEAYAEAAASPVEPVEPVDPAFVEFARRELVEAEAAYLEILTLPEDEAVVDEAEAEAEADDRYHEAIDLTRPEAS